MWYKIDHILLIPNHYILIYYNITDLVKPEFLGHQDILNCIFDRKLLKFKKIGLL